MNMSFFDDLGKNITTKGQAASAAVKEKTEIIKINNAISAQKARQNDVFTEIGKVYYEMHKEDENIEESLVSLVDQVKSFDKQIEQLNLELDAYKKTVVCPICGKEVEKTMAFCGNCGNKLQ